MLPRTGAVQTQAGWTAVDLNGTADVSFASVGGLILDDRDRGACINSAVGSSFDNMWRDFIFADERNVNVGTPAGMDITLSNLMPSTMFSVSIWAFDVISFPTRSMTWNGVEYRFDGQADALPDGLGEKRVSFTVMSDAFGTAVLNGRINTDDAGPCCNVFANGFSVSTVPEPSSMALVAFGSVALGVVVRRRRRA